MDDKDEKDLLIRVIGVESKLESIAKRLDILETQYKVLQDLTMAVRELTINVNNMKDDLTTQQKSVDSLKNEPAECWNTAKKTAFTTIVGVVSGALATGLLLMIAQYIK